MESGTIVLRRKWRPMAVLVSEGGAHTYIADHHLFWSPDQIFGRLDDFFAGIVTCIILHRGRGLSSASARMMAILGIFFIFQVVCCGT